MALPIYVGAGNQGGAAGPGVTAAEPAGSADGDLQFVAIQTANQDPAVYPGKGAGMVDVAGAQLGQGTAGAAGSTLIGLMARIRGGANTGPAVFNDAGNHTIVRMFGVRGQALSDYINLVVTSNQAATTSGSATGGTSTSNENLVCCFIGQAGPDTLEGTSLSSPACTGLTSVTERADLSHDDGVGGLIGMITGEQASAGAFGPFTYTSATSLAKSHSVVVITSGAGGGGGGAGVASKLQQMMCRSWVRIGGLWVPPREIIRPVLVPGFAFSK